MVLNGVYGSIDIEYIELKPVEGTQQGHSYRGRARDLVELHDQVEASVNLLDSLENFLSTFQKDLTAVAGQISELQDRSKDIDNRLKSRRKIEKPLSSLISDITISPSLATTILDSNVGEAWIEAINDLEQRLNMAKSRTRVKAARDLGEVIEGLRIAAATKLRAFFLALFQPIRTNVTTNMQVIQTSVLLKYGPLYAFLQRQAPNVAQEVQRSYVAAARVYYETGFRRYSRSLGWIKNRVPEKFETLVASEKSNNTAIDLERLQCAKIDGPGVTLAYMADNKDHKEYVEALLRSLLLVFMDNATAEYSFLSAFFTVQPALPSRESDKSLFSPTLMSPTLNNGRYGESQSVAGSDYGGQRNISASLPSPSGSATLSSVKEEQAIIDGLWIQILDPVLQYCQTFVKSTLDPMPATIPLLTMIRLTEDVGTEIQMRQCPPVETYIFSLRLQMWPVFQKGMSEHIESLKRIAEGTNSGYFGRASTTTNTFVSNICKRYIYYFNSFVYLTSHEEETMIFSNLLRLRQELIKLITRHTNQISDPVRKATSLSTLFEIVLQGLSNGTHNIAHPKSQQEIAYWANLEEDARRKIVMHSK